MKFGFRTPSFKRSLSAATKGAAKRALMREIVPYYGKRGMGWSNPKKAAYNHLYSMATVNPVDLLTNTSSRRTAAVKPQMSEAEYQEKLSALEIRQIGLKQCETPMALFKMIENDGSNASPMHQAIRRLHSYVLGYMNKPMKCGFDYCAMSTERLLRLQRINPNVKEKCLNIVECIKLGISADDIFKTLSSESPLTTLIAERQIINNSISKKTLPIPDDPPKQQKKQSSKKDLQTWEVVLRCIGAVAGFVLLAWLVLWLIAEFVFPAILFGLIFLSFLFAKK